MAISLKNVRYFIAVAEAESITGATQSLNVSQSVVTESIKMLEADLGTALFTRHARGMVLTHAGHQFLRHAHQILAAVRNAQQAMTARPDTMVGRLNIGVTSLMTGYFLPYLLDRYRRMFPKVEVHVVEDQRDYIEHLLVNGELDVAVLIVSNLQNRQALEAETLVESPYRLWLPVNHPLLELGSISLQEIAGEPLITLKLDELEDVTTSSWRAAGLKPNISVRTTSVEAARSLVATSAGLSILPDVLYRPWSLDGDRLEVRSILEPMPTLEVGIAWRRGSRISEATRNFLLVAREHSRSHAR
ncbi:LysR family transcriptional regulator [Crenobacter sp. SG2305]|uniref:LysR family transcriptional regulator n=1 Tax=Crenobacter oryzisoli TaxID=3056844 RepID=UPI0025AB376D|nr:LysR family transcriptional regulator [Crenobacter sp. SG2305]MDN0084243.1 LysR family transcriptional regulator [Crenobacter sp. SG2305]